MFPNLITHVATTGATVTGNQMTGAIHQDLAAKNLAPGRPSLGMAELTLPLVTGLATYRFVSQAGRYAGPCRREG